MSRFSQFFERQRRSKRGQALDRPELREQTAPRRAPAGVTSFPIKAHDEETMALIDEWYEKSRREVHGG